MKVLLVEDHAATADATARGLREEGHVVDVCRLLRDAETRIRAIVYDVIVLDWGLPDGDGLAYLAELRARGNRTPVLMLTARNQVGERVLGIRTGADDYLGKPFDFEELLARLESLARRSTGQVGVAKLGDVELDASRRLLSRGDRAVTLTAREYALAAELFKHPEEVLPRSRLLQAVWGPDFEGDPTVLDVYLGYLRAKLAEVAGDALAIKNVRGVGFRLVAGGAS